MPKKILIIVSLFSIFCFLCSVTYAQDSVTITTYYPSPYGVYRVMRLYPSNAGTPAGNCGNAGEMYYDNTTNALYICSGSPSTWTPAGGGGSQNVFTTIDVPAGTDPVADSPTDTLTLSVGSGITLTGNSGTDTITVAPDTTYLQRRVTQACASGSSIRVINPDGTVGCELDDNAGLTCITKQGTFNSYGELYCDAGYTAIFGYCGGAAAIWSNGCPFPGNCGLLPNTNAATGMCWRMPPGSTITLYLRCCR